jgi:threonine synthase
VDYNLVCNSCKKKYKSNYDSQICKACEGILEVVYLKSASFPMKMRTIWDFEFNMPKSHYTHYELGNTKIINYNDNAFLKLEFYNPTKSFKDRGSVIEIAKAQEYEYDEIVCASTGNMAYSLAYYAKLANLKVRVFISKNANKDKIRYIKDVHDAKITKVDGDFTLAQAEALKYSHKNRAFLTGDYCYRKERQRIVTYEITYKIKNIERIISPVGNTTLFNALYKAFVELKNANKIKRLPEMFGVEAQQCAPIAKSFNKENLTYVKPNTDADAIAVGMPTYGMEAIDAIKKSNGGIVTVSESELYLEQKNFYKKYGVIVELGGIASLAGYEKVMKKEKNTVILLTGGNV